MPMIITERRFPFQFPLILSLFIVSSVISGCLDGNGNNSKSGSNYLPIAQPLTEEPPDVGEPFLQLAQYDLAEIGYKKHEYFISGVASAYRNLSELGSDGFWEVEPGESADYKTRIVVLRPIDSTQFSGTVLIEWLNVTGGFDRAPGWIAGHTGILREGHVWVGVSAQYAGVEGADESPSPLSLKHVNPDRYGSLVHPGDSFSYDMFSQAGQAIRNPGAIDVLEGLIAQQMLVTGNARSGRRLVTYINAIHPLYNPYDGYLVTRRPGGAKPLAEPPQEPIEVPEVVTIRTDLNVPVMTVQSETVLLTFGSVFARQEDSELFRLWEVAGTSHTDYYTLLNGLQDRGNDPVFAMVTEPELGCDQAINSGIYVWVLNSAISALTDWALNDILPPRAERLEVTTEMSDFLYDELGIVRGGVRTPYVDAPAAILSGEGQTGPGGCYFYGITDLYDADLMASLYVDEVGYVQSVSDAADSAATEGFLHPSDAERIKGAAPLQWESLDF